MTQGKMNREINIGSIVELMMGELVVTLVVTSKSPLLCYLPRVSFRFTRHLFTH